jgi:hypothetical protein
LLGQNSLHYVFFPSLICIPNMAGGSFASTFSALGAHYTVHIILRLFCGPS